jgi:HK97 family phage major capsid protein
MPPGTCGCYRSTDALAQTNQARLTSGLFFDLNKEMTMSIKALREQKQELARQAKQLLAASGDKVWSKEDKAKFDGLADQIEAIDGQLATMQRLLEEDVEKKFSDAETHDPKDPKNEKRGVMAKFLRHGDKALTMQEHQSIRNTMSTTTVGQGGYTVQSDIAKELIDKLAGYAGMRTVASRIVTDDGGPLSYPTSDGTSETGEWIAENTTATATDPSFGTVALNTFKASSKIIAVPFELLQDSSIDVVAMVYKRINDRLGRTMNTAFTVGSGSAQPNGLVTAASVGKTGTTGQTLTIIYDDLVDLIDSIDYAYMGATLRFMTSQSMRKVLRKIKDTTGRPIWTPNYDAGIAGGFTDQLLGYELVLNNDFAVPAANAKSMAFGDMSKYMIRDAMQLTLFRFDDSAYAKLGQVGFLAWMRAGGNLIDTAAVKLYQHSAT